jgi:hypothetical protein
MPVHEKNTSMDNEDLNRVIGKVEDAKTSIDEARTEDNDADRDTLLDDAHEALEQVTEELEEDLKS